VVEGVLSIAGGLEWSRRVDRRCGALGLLWMGKRKVELRVAYNPPWKETGFGIAGGGGW
jgi:hypothetical protein